MFKKSEISLKKKIGLFVFQKIKKNLTRLHELSYLFWECTLRCSLNCLHCGSDCKKSNSVKDMPIADFLSVIDNIKPTVNSHKTMIILTGGEPLLRNDLEQCGLELYKREFPWGIVTNGYLLSQERLNSLQESGLRSLTISLDGLEDEHNWFRGDNKSYQKAINAIAYATKAKDLIFDVVTCVNQRNVSQLNLLKDKLISVGVKKWRLFTIIPIGRASENPLLQLDNQQFKAVLEFIKRCRLEGKIDTSYGCEGFLGSYEGEVRNSFFFCRAGISVGSVLADGSISGCPSLRDNFIQGNIYKDNFTDVWESRFDIMRNRTWTKTGKCVECKYYSWCEGGALHLRNEKTGELLFCHLDRIIDI